MRSEVVFLLTILGIGCFSYYQGRSHNANLFVCSPIMAFILLTIYADDMLKIVRKYNIFILPFALILFILSFSFFQTIYDYKKITGLIFEKDDKILNEFENNIILNNIKFIKQNTKVKERILIFSNPAYQGIYFGNTNTLSAINPGLEDLFYKKDYQRILTFLIKNDSTKVFLQPNSVYRWLSDNQVPIILSEFYYVYKTNGNIILLKKKKLINPSEHNIFNYKNDLFHKIFDDTLSKRLIYSKSSEHSKKSVLSLGKRFSVQVIFKPSDIPNSLFSNWGQYLAMLQKIKECF